MSDIIKLKGGQWINQTELKAHRKFFEQFEKRMYYIGYGNNDEFLAKRVTRNAVALPQSRWKEDAWKCGEHYSKTWMGIKKYTFIRWARDMDI